MSSSLTTLSSSCFALFAFAANSVLCRLALGDSSIDPASFTVIRILSGAFTLAMIVMILPRYNKLVVKDIFTLKNNRGWFSSLMLFCYALFFSFAYVKLNTASGALILFATVQFVMLGINLFRGYRLHLLEWLGVLISFSGFVLLMLPSATQPSVAGFMLMLIAGISWALYTLEGKSAEQPIMNTAENFIRCIPLAIILLLSSFWMSSLSLQGVLLAMISGSIASGIGYAVWYIALRQLSITQAAISQLSVPLIAALGGVIFVAEALTQELLAAGALILGGIAMVSLKKLWVRNK